MIHYTAKAIGKALVWVFDQIKFGFNTIIELVGLIANWGFVTDWSNSIGTFINAGLEEAAEKGPKDHVAAHKSSIPTNSANISQNWALDQFQHGGGLEVLKGNGSSQGLNTANSNLDGISPSLTKAIDEIKTVITALGELGKVLGNDIWDLIRGNCSFETFMKRVGNDISGFVLDVLRKIATHIIDKISHAARSLKNLLSRRLFVPVFSYLWEKFTGKHLALLTLASLLPKWEGNLNKGNFGDFINNRVDRADAARTVKPFFESLQLITSVLDAITSFWDYTFDGVGLGAYSMEIGVLDGAVAVLNILVNLPLPSDRRDVPGIPRNIGSYLNGSTAVLDLIFKALKWKKNEVFKLLSAGLSSVSAWTRESQPQVALAAEVGKLAYSSIRTALKTLLIACRNGSVNLTVVNDGSGVQVMMMGQDNLTKLMMILDHQWVTNIPGTEFSDLVFGDGFSEKKQLEFSILRQGLELPIPKEVEVEAVEE
ncbi:hypothetical protein N0V84_003844 [Fusarium piperis]|uniref:Uncharacterized protein n=1 Tax=Fusarium piperis TaxID=1435070 RepID=A0A9W8WGN1_9HYPO|nr:hypothetical protein N0V84_003844 [Fusarium piperis]